MLRTRGPGATPKPKIGQVVEGDQHHETTSGKALGLRGLVLIGMGGIIGAGFFLGAGLPIRTAGPAVLLAYLIGAVVMAQVTGALASLALDDPQPGAFMTYAEKYIGSFAGFLEGWTYYIGSILTIASESVAMSVFSHLWIGFLPSWALTSIYAAIVIAINAFGVRNFGRVESLMSVMKIGALVGFILFIGVMLLLPNHQLGGTGGLTAGTHALFSKGFFATGANGLFQSMLIVIFAYAGIGVFATATTEMKNPKDINKAAWMTTLGLTVLYILSIGLMLFVIPWHQISTNNSPFVLALERSGIPWLGNILNFIILIASFSVMAGAVFSANQILQGLGATHQAPNFVRKTNGRGTPFGSLMVTTVGVGLTILISYLLPANVYSFLISASSFLTFLNWFLILWAFLSWRHRSRSRRVDISSLAFGQPISSVLTMLFIVFLTGYSLMQAAQRFGFYAFAALCILITACFFLIPSLRRASPQRQE